MNKAKGITILATIFVAAVAVLTGSVTATAANINTTGVEFKAANGSDQDCLTVHSFAGLTNNCGYRVTVVAWMPIVNTGWHDTSVNVYGNNSWCQTVSTNGVGNGAHVGSTVWTSAGPDSLNTLDTGSRYVWSDTPVMFRCGLDAGERVYLATAVW